MRCVATAALATPLMLAVTAALVGVPSPQAAQTAQAAASSAPTGDISVVIVQLSAPQVCAVLAPR